MRCLLNQSTFFLHFTVSWVGLLYQCSSFLCADLRCYLVSSFQPPNCLFSFQLQSAFVHGEFSYLCLPPCCWDFWSLSCSSASPILLFGFDFPSAAPLMQSVLVSVGKWAANLWRSLQPRSHFYLFLTALKALSWAFNKSTCLQTLPLGLFCWEFYVS